jgi:hypothetical protein
MPQLYHLRVRRRRVMPDRCRARLSPPWNCPAHPEQRPHFLEHTPPLWKSTLLADMIATRALTTAALLASLAFAAAAQSPDADREMARLLARPRQLLLPEELRGNCAGLTVTIKTHIDRLRTLQKQAKQEQEGPPSTLFGDRPAVQDFATEQERVQALNIVLDAKGCRPVNIDEELKNPAPTPTPPVAQQRKEPAAAGRALLGR